MTAFFVIANWDVNRPNALQRRISTIPTGVIVNEQMEYVSGDSSRLVLGSVFKIPQNRTVTITILPQVKTGLPPGAYMFKLATYTFDGNLINPMIDFTQPLSGSFIALFRTSSLPIILYINFTLVDAVTQIDLNGIEKFVIKVDVSA